jgi:hypothetical protein
MGLPAIDIGQGQSGKGIMKSANQKAQTWAILESSNHPTHHF